MTGTQRDRLPPIPPEAMTPAQRDAAAEITAGPRGAVVGPFIAALRSPEFMRRLQAQGEYLRFHNALGRQLTEFAILLVARHWTQQFEWAMHVPYALEQGVSPHVIDAIAMGKRPEPMTAAETAVFDFFVELNATQAVTDGTYARAIAALGEAGVIDLIGTIGYYTTLAMILNVAQTPVPDVGTRPLAEMANS